MVEYTLLLAFVALAAGAAYVTIGNNISSIWSKAQADVVSAPLLLTKSVGVGIAAGRVIALPGFSSLPPKGPFGPRVLASASG